MHTTPSLERVGPYRVVQELGRGGMGVVYLAERDDGQFRRQVAVKLLRASPDTEELKQRFFAERQILASLNHPNIAQLLDGGVTEAHLPYLVMEYVDGLPITTYCDRQRLGVEERLRLFHDVCAAVHHAHQNLVIHRDIKPSNILVTSEGRVKLLDFGIAKLMNPALGPADAPMTRTQWRVMTPEYASPEQVRGDSLTTASDVYALGVLLYELLSGRRPHRITSGSSHELAEMIVQRDPRLPSVAVSRPESGRTAAPDGVDATPESVAGDRGLSVDRLKRRLEGDLDAIIMMALRKETARRYGSADVMWEDVQRHLDGLPVVAHRATRWYRARRFLGRHRVQAIGATVVAASLVTAATVTVRQAAAARRERDRAEKAAGQAKEVTDFLVRLFRTQAAAGATRDQVTVHELLASGTARVEELSSQPVVQAQMLDALGRVNDQLGRFDEAERMLRRALELRRSQFGNDHPDVALTLKNLAAVLSQKDRGEEALLASREALGIQQRVLGPRHADVALTMINVASLTRDKAVAESLYQAARDIQRSALGADNLAVATTDISLADIRRQRGASEEAEALLRESLAIRTRQYGPEHGGTALSMVFLAHLLRNYRNKPAEAESLYNRALVILRRQPASGLPMLVGALAGLVEIADERGDHTKAEVYAREIVAAQQRTWGVEHPVTTDGMEIVAEQVAAQGRYAEADKILTDVLGILERGVGPQHFRFGSALIDRGWERAAAGRLAEAEADLRRALPIMESSEGPTSRYVGVTAALLGELTARRGGTVESDALFDRAASILRPLPRQASRDSRTAYAALANHYRAQRRTADEEFFRRLAR